MSQINIKNNKNTYKIWQGIGVTLMSIAALIGLVEVPERPTKAILFTPAYVFSSESHDVNPLRREREETSPHYVSYNASQRTPGRMGKY